MPATVPRLTSSLQATLPPTGVDGVSAYEALSAEYDSPAHETTRRLERASLIALRSSGLLATLEAGSPSVVELGTGTGALTVGLLNAQRCGRLLISDPAPGMLRAAMAKLQPISNGVVLEPFLASAAEALTGLAGAADLVVAGLCDPYLSPELVLLAKETGGPRTQTFVTVPAADWATKERGLRLGLPLDQTRFRLRNGKTVYSKSTALGETELVGLFEDCGLELIRHGTVRLPSSSHKPTTEVAWCWAGPSS